MAWPPSAVLEGGARREALGGMESELVPTEPSQTYPIASVRVLPIIETRPTNKCVSRPRFYVQIYSIVRSKQEEQKYRMEILQISWMPEQLS